MQWPQFPSGMRGRPANNQNRDQQESEDRDQHRAGGQAPACTGAPGPPSTTMPVSFSPINSGTARCPPRNLAQAQRHALHHPVRTRNKVSSTKMTPAMKIAARLLPVYRAPANGERDKGVLAHVGSDGEGPVGIKPHEQAAEDRREDSATVDGSGGIPASLRIAGLTTTMYDMVVKVVRPAINSRLTVVPCCCSLKNRCSPPGGGKVSVLFFGCMAFPKESKSAPHPGQKNTMNYRPRTRGFFAGIPSAKSALESSEIPEQNALTGEQGKHRH